jgi:hypothetical protein
VLFRSQVQQEAVVEVGGIARTYGAHHVDGGGRGVDRAIAPAVDFPRLAVDANLRGQVPDFGGVGVGHGAIVDQFDGAALAQVGGLEYAPDLLGRNLAPAAVRVLLDDAAERLSFLKTLSAAETLVFSTEAG